MKWIKVNSCVGEEHYINLEKLSYIKAKQFRNKEDNASINNSGVQVQFSVVDDEGNERYIYMYSAEWEKIKQAILIEQR